VDEEFPFPPSEDISALYAMRTVDDEFASQLEVDKTLWNVYDDKMRGELAEEEMKHNALVSSHVQTIERAFKNRINFAVNQKRRVLRLLESIRPAERNRVTEEAQEDLDSGMAMLLHFSGTLRGNAG